MVSVAPGERGGKLLNNKITSIATNKSEPTKNSFQGSSDSPPFATLNGGFHPQLGVSPVSRQLPTNEQHRSKSNHQYQGFKTVWDSNADSPNAALCFAAPRNNITT